MSARFSFKKLPTSFPAEALLLASAALRQPLIGRGEANVFEPTQLRVKRIYRVQWKKAPINPDELAKLYWEEGLTMAEIAKELGVGRTTVRDHIAPRLGAPRRRNGG